MDSDELAVTIEFSDWEEHANEQVLILLSSEITIDEAGEVTLDYLTWAGIRGTLVTFGLDANSAIIGEGMTRNEDAFLVSYRPVSYSARESYLIDLASHEVRAFKETCDLPLPMGIGPEFIAFACTESKQTWHFINLNDATDQLTLELPDSAKSYLFLEPLWLNRNEIIYVEARNNSSCFVDVTIWDPVCKGLDFWLGPMSPDGSLFEIRTGSEIAPNEIGIINSDCVTKSTVPCNPQLTKVPSDMAPVDSATRAITDSVWQPEGDAIYYIVQLNTDKMTIAKERSEIWRFDLAAQSFEMLYNLPGELYFGEPRFELAPASWSPDGKRVIVKDGPRISKLNIETGELTLLTEGGVLLGTITLP
ncbi:MAG: hypothetical protein P1P76_08970 [Anaerolineales bacterium]|nr:hypothetical protein [Anaerolineales bacterium]